MTTKLKLDDNQLFALMKFRKAMSDCPQPNCKKDQYLLRWLRARSWNVDEAEKMLRNSLDWRKRWNIDEIADWEAPEILKTHLPYGCCGFHEDGSPIVVTFYSGFDIVGLLNACEKKEILKRTFQILEWYIKMAEERNSDQIISIIDLEGFSIRPYTWRPAGDLVISLIKLYEANYPEVLKTCFVVNAPKVFAFAFKIVKPFLNELTLNKINIHKADPEHWKKELLKIVSEDQIPVHFGGKLADPDGNPKLLSKICCGGLVPKEFYKSKKDAKETNPEENGEFATETVKRGSKLVLEYPVSLPNCLLKWDFKSDKYDIKFGVESENTETGETTTIVPLQKCESDKNHEVGFIPCDPKNTYKVIFDNSYSYFRDKKVHYNIEVSEILENISNDSTVSVLDS